MRYQTDRIGYIIKRDPTRPLQLLCAAAGFIRGLLAYITTSPADLTDAMFYYFPRWAWVAVVVGLSGWQWWAAGTRRWWVKYRVAALQFGLLIYALAIAVLTGNQDRIGLTLVLLIAQAWIALRARHDKDLNGWEQRGSIP